MLEIKGKINTAICYANVIEEEAITVEKETSFPVSRLLIVLWERFVNLAISFCVTSMAIRVALIRLPSSERTSLVEE